MRIAVVAPLIAPLLPASPYGPHAFLIDLARALGQRGHDVRVYCAAGSEVPDLRLCQVPVGVLVKRATVAPRAGPARPAGGSDASGIGAEASAAVCEAFGRVFVEIDRQGADVVSQHAFDAAAIDLAEGRPVLHTLHLPPIVPSVVAAARATRSVLATVSQACRRDWEAAGVPGVRILRNGVPDWNPGRPTVEPVALMAGRISPEKGDAVGIRVALRAGLRPCLVGEPYDLAYFEEEVAPLLGSVDYLPTMPRRDLWRMMAQAAVTVMPIAWEEPFGLVAAEAQMAGCPVVAYRRGALPEVVEEGVSGFLVAPGDEDGLVTAIDLARQLDRDQVRASARGRLGLSAAVDAYEHTLLAMARKDPGPVQH